MQKIAGDLYCVMSQTGNTRTYCYLVKRKQGNVLIHGLDRKQHRLSRDTLAELGGVQHQLMCHWHEAKHCDPAFYQEHSPELHAPELDRGMIQHLLGPAVKISSVAPRKRLLGEFVPHHVSGQTPGFTVYHWRDYVFGADFMVRHGDRWNSFFSPKLVKAGLEGLDALRRVPATHWFPAKSTSPAPVPFEFGPSVLDAVEQKLRKKHKVPGPFLVDEPEHPAAGARGRASKRTTRRA